MKNLPLIFAGILTATSAITLAQTATGTGDKKFSHGDSRYESGSGATGTDRGTSATGSSTTGGTGSGMGTGTTASNTWNSASSRTRR